MMKRKGIFWILTCLLAVVLCATAFSMTAFASGYDDDTVEGTENSGFHTHDDLWDTDDALSEKTEQIGTVTTNGGFLYVRSGAGMEHTIFAQLQNGQIVEVLGTEGEWVKVLLTERVGYVHTDYMTVTDVPITDDTTDSEPGTDNENAITPDGNMSLIDDIATEDGGKQFLTVQTKNGNIFYIIIDRDDDGELTVHFLNQVDEDDLFALIEDENTEIETPTCICADKCSIGAINTACPVCLIQMSQCQGAEPTPTVPTEPTDPKPTVTPTEENSGIGGMIAIVIIIVAGLGGAGFYFFVAKPKQKKTVKIPSVLDDFDLEDEEEYLNEDTEESE